MVEGRKLKKDRNVAKSGGVGVWGVGKEGFKKRRRRVKTNKGREGEHGEE